jgi:hypothetical protein
MGVYLGPFRLTKRGVRVRVGPRIARLHVGAGGTGISTGAGPFTAYKSLSGGKRRSRAQTWSGFYPDGRRCPHRHRTLETAQACTARLARQAGYPPVYRLAPEGDPASEYFPGVHHPGSAYRPPALDRPPMGWPGWTTTAAIAALVVSFTLSVIGGSDTGGAAASASGAIGALAVTALLAAIPGAIWRRYRWRHPAPPNAVPPRPVYPPDSACPRCGRPTSEHTRNPASAFLECPGTASVQYEAPAGQYDLVDYLLTAKPGDEPAPCGMCGQPFDAHKPSGTALMCPVPGFEPCYRCGQPVSLHNPNCPEPPQAPAGMAPPPPGYS